MGKIEKGISTFIDGQERSGIVKLEPKYFSMPALIRIAAFQVFHHDNRQCIIVNRKRRIIVSSDYMGEVINLEPELRKSHILATAASMRTAGRVYIHQRIPEND